MKLLKNKKFIQKIVIVLIALITLNFSVPVQTEAFSIKSTFAEIGGDLLEEVVHLLASIGDVVMGAFNHFMLGTTNMVSSSMLDKTDPNITDASFSDSSLYAGEGADLSNVTEKTVPEDYELEGLFWKDWKVPNFLYCPENIFSNKIAMLDVNFIDANKYEPVEYKDGEAQPESERKAQSAAGDDEKQGLRKVIMKWYRGFRNLAIVGLLIVLMYLGIRIMLSSTSSDKAKYKESLGDWLVALCLVAVIHYIMAGILMIVDNFTALIDNASNQTILVKVPQESDSYQFKTNLTGYVRFLAQSDDFGNATAYTLIYLVLVIYTCVFTFTYFRRFLYVAFFTMISPLVALTYPIDKIRDGKAQAFDLWLKEYTMNIIIQPIHLILYTVFVGGAMDLAASNPIYAIVAIGFMVPAEKFIKKMFGVESQTSGGLTDIAGPAMAYAGISKLLGTVNGKGKKQKDLKDSNVESGKLDRGTNIEYTSDPTDIIGGVLPIDRDNPNPPSKKAVEQKDEYDLSQQDKDESAIHDKDKSTMQDKDENRFQDRNRVQDKDESRVQNRDESRLQDKDESKLQDKDNVDLQNENGKTQENINKNNFEQPNNKYDTKAQNMGTAKDLDQKDSDVQHNEGSHEKDSRRSDKQNEHKPDSMNENDYENDYEKQRSDKPYEQSQRDSNESDDYDIPDVLIAGPDVPTRKERFKAGSSSVYAAGKRTLKRATVDKVYQKGDSKGKVVGKVFKTVGKAGAKMAVKGGAMAALGTAGAVAGLAAGVATGDPSKALQYAVGAGSLGLSAGRNLGNTAIQRAGQLGTTVKEEYELGAYTKEERKQRKQAEYDRNWKNDKENYKYLRNQGMNDQKAREFLTSDETQQYLNAGVTDIKLIHNATKLTDARGNKYAPEQAVARAKMASNLGKNYVNDASAQNALMENVRKRNININERMAQNLNKDMIKLLK